MKNFRHGSYYVADHNDFDELIQTAFGIPGFDAQRVYLWPNDTQMTCTSDRDELDEDPEEHVEQFVQFITDAENREAAIVKLGEREQPWYISDAEIDQTFILDRLIDAYKEQWHTIPAIDEFLVVLAERGLIPAGNFLVYICW